MGTCSALLPHKSILNRKKIYILKTEGCTFVISNLYKAKENVALRKFLSIWRSPNSPNMEWRSLKNPGLWNMYLYSYTFIYNQLMTTTPRLSLMDFKQLRYVILSFVRRCGTFVQHTILRKSKISHTGRYDRCVWRFTANFATLKWETSSHPFMYVTLVTSCHIIAGQ